MNAESILTLCKGEKKMNSIELRQVLISMIPSGNKHPWIIYENIVDAIMKFYFCNGLGFDYPQAIVTFKRFIDTDILQFKPV